MDMGGIKNVADSTSNQDVAIKNYVHGNTITTVANLKDKFLRSY